MKFLLSQRNADFPVLIKTIDGKYFAECLTLTGCVAQDVTREGALRAIKESIALFLRAGAEIQDFDLEMVNVEDPFCPPTPASGHRHGGIE